jgi:hypothetical protein
MFGAFIRAAVVFAAGMLFSTVLKAVFEASILPVLASGLGKSSLLYRSFDGVQYWMPLLVLLAVVLKLIARSTTESQLAR